MSKDLLALIPALTGITVNPSSSVGVLGEGNHLVVVQQVSIVRDFEKLDLRNPVDGIFPVVDKEGYTKPWENDSAQLAVVFSNKDGQFTNYFSLSGFFSNIEDFKNANLISDDAWLAANGLSKFKNKLDLEKHFSAVSRSAEKYICFDVKNQPVIRVSNPANTAISASIVSSMLVAAGEVEGEDFATALGNFIESVESGDDLEVQITIAPREIDDKIKEDYAMDKNRINLRVVKVSPPTAELGDYHSPTPTANGDDFSDLDDDISSM